MILLLAIACPQLPNEGWHNKLQNRSALHSIAMRLAAMPVPFILDGGSLIGAHFNGKVLPWDDDIDVALLERDVDRFVAALPPPLKPSEVSANVARHTASEKGRYIFFGADGFVFYRDQHPNHHVPYRCYHAATGLYADINVYYTLENNIGTEYYRPRTRLKMKGGSRLYPASLVLPIRPCMFEHQVFYCPADTKSVLIRNNGPGVLLPKYKSHVFKDGCWH